MTSDGGDILGTSVYSFGLLQFISGTIMIERQLWIFDRNSNIGHFRKNWYDFVQVIHKRCSNDRYDLDRARSAMLVGL